MRHLLAALAFFASSAAFAGAAPTSQTYAAQHVDQFRNGTPGMMIFKDESSNGAYMVQGNPATGALLVEGEFAVDILAQGLNGDPIPSYSLLVGGNSSGDLIPIKVGADGTVATSGTSTVAGTVAVSNFPATVASTQSGTWTVQPGNTANTTAWLFKESGHSYADSARNVYSSTNVTTGAWVQLIASTAAAINCLTIFDSSGQTLELGTGAAASETRKLIIPPGGLSGCISLAIPASTRVSIRAISATASVGELDITGLN